MEKFEAHPQVLVGRVVNEDGGAASFTLRDSVFVCCIDQAKKKGRALHLNEVQLQDAGFERTLFELSKGFSQGEYKIIGSKKRIESVQSLLARKSLKVSKAIIREGIVRIIFYPEQGRVSLEKQFESKEKVGKTRVLIVDDSKTIQNILHKTLASDPGIEVIGAVGNPLLVPDLVAKEKPDVITMDINMPEMDGPTLVSLLMEKHPTPIVMISALRPEDGPSVLQALENGAVDYIHKPSFQDLESTVPVIIEKVKGAAVANIRRTKIEAATGKILHSKMNTNRLVVIGSSTGGTEALRVLLTQLPAEIPPILIVQHIPPVFSEAFAIRMNSMCPFEVREAKDGDEVRPGLVLVAPGGFQMDMKAGKTFVRVFDGQPVNRHKPSVDVLFHSVAEQIGKTAIGVILTGMGADGAKGLKAMRDKGSQTVAQSEDTCVVFGMPREAIKLGGAEVVEDLPHISERIVTWLASKRAA